MTKNTSLRGVFAPILTPLDDDLNPDVDRMVRFARTLLDDGCHGLVIFGTTGEANSFSAAERKHVLEGLIDAGLPAEVLLVGTGVPSVTETADLSAHATALGCAGVLMLPPFYYKGVSDEGLFHAYAQVIDRVDDERLRIYLYHIPQVAVVGISLALIERLRSNFPDIVVGIKDSSGDWANQRAILENFPDLGTFSGTEKWLLENVRHGGRGTISATANVIAGEIRALYDGREAADAAARQKSLMRMRERLAPYATIPALKAMVAERFDDEGWLRVRPPLVALMEEERRTLLAASAVVSV